MSDGPRCSARVHDGSFKGHQCRNTGLLSEDGRHWCGVHAPSTKAKFRARAEARCARRQVWLERVNAISTAKDRVFEEALAYYASPLSGQKKLFKACADYERIVSRR